jgi:hypothetical protein
LPSSSLLVMAVSPVASGLPVPTEAAEVWLDEVEAEIDVQPETLPRTRRQPALERAQGVVNQLFPDGIPDQVKLPNTLLCSRVGAHLKEANLPPVSDDTILRAAGRRKDRK